MVRIEAKTLDEAYIEASKQLNCSITDLNVEIVQNPSAGVLGFFKKSAIIVATANVKADIFEVEKEGSVSKKDDKIDLVDSRKSNFKHENVQSRQKVVEKTEKQPLSEAKVEYQNQQTQNVDVVSQAQTKSVNTALDKHDLKPENDKKELFSSTDTNIENSQKDIFDTFYSEKIKKSKDEILQEIKSGINNMFKHSCFDVDEIKVVYYDENTIYIEIRGNDAALLIGKEGYRYKALSYMIFNWINSKYNLMLRLEIAEFLKNQEEMMTKFLEPFIEKVKKDGRGQTKPLDGVLVHIALTQLRDEFPNKYVSVRTNSDGEKFVIVNDFKSNAR